MHIVFFLYTFNGYIMDNEHNFEEKNKLTGQKISFVGICFFFVVSCRVLISVFLLRTDMKSFPNWNKKNPFFTMFTWHCMDLLTSKKRTEHFDRYMLQDFQFLTALFGFWHTFSWLMFSLLADPYYKKKMLKNDTKLNFV